MDLQFGIEFTATVHLISDEAGQEANVQLGMGVNKIPDKAYVDELVRVSIQRANETLGVNDFRLITLGDRGFAEPADGRLGWNLDEVAQ